MVETRTGYISEIQSSRVQWKIMEVEGDILEAMDRGKTHDNLWGLTD